MAVLCQYLLSRCSPQNWTGKSGNFYQLGIFPGNVSQWVRSASGGVRWHPIHGQAIPVLLRAACIVLVVIFELGNDR